MLQEQRSSSHRIATWGNLSLLGLICLTLAACGGQAHARAATTPIPAATVNTKGAGETAGHTPPPHSTLPYSFPTTWHNAPGMPQLNTVDPTNYAFAPSDGRIGYLCGGTTGHLYATYDGGDSWQALHVSAFSGCGGVFIDAHNASDVFVQTSTAASTNGIPNGYDLWRSRDGGATWSKLGAVTGTGYRLVWSQIAVIGSRLVCQVMVDQEGYLQNDLYASDDGGMTWKPFAQSVANQGYTLSGFALIGSAIYITSSKGVGGAGMRAPIWPTSGSLHTTRTTHVTMRPLNAPLSGQPPTLPTFWRSLDGGWTWSQVTLPGQNLTWVPPVAGGQGTYALSTTLNDVASVDQQPIYDEAIWWSADGGGTWRRLPDLRGIEQGYVIGGSAVALAPDGSVFALAQHDPAGSGDDAGVFRIHPSDAASTWQPLVAGRTQAFSADLTSSGLRLWSIGAYGPDSYLKYVDVG